MTTEPDLTDTERAMLDLERGWFQYSGEKERVIRERFDLSATRYYQLLLALICTDQAERHDPVTVRRLRRLRDRKRAVRSGYRRPA